MIRNAEDYCPRNEAVVCEEKNQCHRCGWNPEVAEERSKRIREELRKRTEGGSHKCQK